MSKFIKLTSLIINTNQLNSILIKPDKYILYANNRINGYLFFMGGTISSDNEILEICAIKEPTDYKIIKKWIEDIV